jgi:hypothetical protein
MVTGPKKTEIAVSEEQRRLLKQLIRRRSTPQYLVKRARIVLESVEGVSNSEISRAASSGSPTSHIMAGTLGVPVPPVMSHRARTSGRTRGGGDSGSS